MRTIRRLICVVLLYGNAVVITPTALAITIELEERQVTSTGYQLASGISAGSLASSSAQGISHDFRDVFRLEAARSLPLWASSRPKTRALVLPIKKDWMYLFLVGSAIGLFLMPGGASVKPGVRATGITWHHFFSQESQHRRHYILVENATNPCRAKVAWANGKPFDKPLQHP